MKTILIVDDETPFLLSLKDGLRDHAGDYQVRTAGNGREAVAILDTVKIDLLVTDLKMPVMDGFELLAYLSRRQLGIPVVVMTAFGTQEIENRLKKIDNFHYLEKPLDLDLLAGTIDRALAAGSRSYIRGITLATFLQLVQMEHKTCTLKIKSRGRVGFLHIRKGELLAAETDTVGGEHAAYDIVCWPDPEIEMEGVCRKTEKTIAASIEHVLLEAFRIEDERREALRQQTPVASAAEPACDTSLQVSDLLKESSGLFYAGKDQAAAPIAAAKAGRETPPWGRLADFFRRSEVVSEYGIFDDRDFVVDSYPDTTGLARLAPSIYLGGCRQVASLLKQPLRYLEFKRKNGARQLLFRVGGYQVAVALKPGVRSGDFMARFTPGRRRG